MFFAFIKFLYFFHIPFCSYVFICTFSGFIEFRNSSVARSDNSVFDVNKDGSLDGKDFRTSNGNDGAGAAAVNGKKLGGAPGQPVSIAGQECVTDSTGKVTCEKSSSPEPLGRQSWIELRN